MKIERILIEDQMAPIGLDEKKPAFSWLLTAEEGEQNLMQSACRIVVRTGEDTVWDSGKMETGVSTGIGYEGEALQPCTKYEVKAEVWDNHGGKAEAESSFETGLMDSLYAAWEGAKWIGAPHATVCAENRGVFTIESEFRMEGGKGRTISVMLCALRMEMHASKFTAWAMRRRIQRKNRLPLRNWSTGKRKHRKS